MMLDLFGSDGSDGPQQIAPGAYLHHGVALPFAEELWRWVQAIDDPSPFRQMITPGGQIMSVSMTNCGTLGWVSDRKGYRYQCGDPLTGRAWPVMPKSFADLARSAAATAGYLGFQPNACLVNRYEPGTRLTLHQDKDEGDFIAPIVSVSLGLPAKFLFGGLQRSDRPRRIILHHGDVVVWGGPTRLAYHGIDTLKPGSHPLIGACRINLTFRSVALPPSGSRAP